MPWLFHQKYLCRFLMYFICFYRERKKNFLLQSKSDSLYKSVCIMLWSHYHHPNAPYRTVLTFILTFFFFGSCDKKALPCYFAAALEHHKKTTTTTKKTRGKKTFEHRQCRTLPCLSRVWERYLLFASVSVSEHIYIFPYKVNSHISSLLKVFTLLRYLLCEHFRRIFFEPLPPK